MSIVIAPMSITSAVVQVTASFPSNTRQKDCIGAGPLDKAHISAYKIAPMRRKPGALLPLEYDICRAAAKLLRRGTADFHGYELAKSLADGEDTRLLTAYGTLYRALGRLQQMGLLDSRWEDPHIPARENRPGRRLYRLTALGEQALREATAARTETARKGRRRRLAPA
jgi:DNA-binding PadR family transcriptional regulator